VSDGRQVDDVKRQVEMVHGLPKYSIDPLVLDFKTANWNTEHFFYGGFSYFMPEQKRIFAYPMTIPEYNNKVFFAGEHIGSTHAWMQAALETGMKAANTLALQCRRENF